MSSDFDKSDDDEGIDFHEAERLSVEHFERTYPEFVALFNRTIREEINRGQWTIQLPWWGPSTPIVGPRPSKSTAYVYFRKIGFDLVPSSNN